MIFITTPTRVPIAAPDGNDLPTPRVPEWEQLVNIQPGQVTSHHHNKNQILYLMNTT